MQGSLKVLHLASGDLWAGAEVQLYQLARALADMPRTEIAVVLLNHGLLETRLREAGIKVTVIDETRHGGLSILRQLVRLFRRERPDIVHTHRQKENVLGSLAARLAGVAVGVRTVHGAPEFAASGLKRRVSRALDRWSARWLQDRVIMVTQDLAQQLRGAYPHRKVSIIENGIAPISPAPVEAPRFARADKINVAFAGRLVTVKRVDVFAAIARECAQKDDARFHFHVFGDGPLSESLDEQISREGTEELISKWGFVDGLEQALAEMDVLVMTSNHEGLPMVMLEAMSLGLPIVAHAVGGMPEVLADGECGVLVSRHDGAGFHAALSTLTDPGVRASVADRARARFEAQYTVEVCASRTRSLYEQSLGAR